MTRQPSPTRNSPTSWLGFKELARQQYERGNYEAALTSYTAAIHPDLHCPASEQQILLSNLVACRLKIGGPAQARAAVDNAKQCIALNPSWAKGHVRLASSYIALGGHSNDACNELQRALSLDPGNSMAREMLLRELRRDHAAAASTASTSGTGTTSENAHNNSQQFTDQTPPPNQSQNHQQQSNNHQNHHVDDSLTIWERFEFHWGRATAWYHSQSSDLKTVLKIILLLLVLYVAFGGRFGLANNTRSMGNYGSNSAYDQYRRYGTTESVRQQQQQSRSSYPYNTNNRRTTQQRNHDNDYYYDDYSSSRQRGNSSWSTGGGFNPFDGSLQSMMLLGGIAFAGHRMGINPFHTMMMMNALGGGRRRFRPMGGGGFGGMGYGGFGGARRGFGRRRF
ncbi:tetratricopeptide repeat domain [Seminavis robusta]|uniref:Tetratricopeptide repeat domain n=1 Tax=Seminavis robusta TaxID=568900 RepID=A0A9N8ELV7_9STRA|nr:tetratricopeptide repeat domain [Seminavis robusta]|eukprot:Sro1504_g278140.1 tetratricopeptide repeat domain (395) ;mRNA; f:17676-18860